MSATTFNSKKVIGIIGIDDIKSFKKHVNKKNMNEPLDLKCLPENILSYAICCRAKKIVNFLLDEKADVNIHYEHSAPALELAVERENEEAAFRLFEMGADIIDLDIISNAINLGMYAFACYLINEGVDVNLCEGGFSLPLIAAIYNESLPMIALLIKEGANVNFREEDTCSPIEAAVHTGNIQIIKLLHRKGCEFKGLVLRNDSYCGMNQEVVDYLKKHGVVCDRDKTI